MIKKISYNDAAYVLGYKKNHKVSRHCCVWTLKKWDDCNFEITGKFKLWLYIILFIPASLCNIGYAIWEDGLKNFTRIDRIYTRMNINKSCHSVIFQRAESVWSR